MSAGVGLALVWVMLSGTVAAADTVLAGGMPQAPKVSAAGAALAWSAYDGAVGAWRLVVLRDGVTQMPAIAPSPVPFDADLGDDGHGALVAAYSRCSAFPHGCRLYVYEFATASERPIAVANLAGASQFLPSIAAGRVAFVRIDDRRPVGAGNPERIYVQSLAGGKPKRLPGGTQDARGDAGPTALDLSATALAFAWDAHGDAGYHYPEGTSELRVDGLSGGQTLVELDAQETIQGIEVLSPTLVTGGVYYGVASFGDTTDYRFRSFGLPGARPGVASAPAGLASTATGPAGTIYSRCPSASFGGPAVSQSCEVDLAARIGYSDPDRQVAHTSRPTTVSAYYGNWQAWSAYDPVSRTYRLMAHTPNGRTSAVAVPARRVPFDVQLGSRSTQPELHPARGGAIAVYSRCRVEPRLDPRDQLPLPSTGRGCRLYRYDFASSRERLIPGSGSRYLPALWGNELAFVSAGPGGAPVLYLGSLTGLTAPRRLPGGNPGTRPGLGPRALALHGNRLAFVWEHRVGATLRSELRLDTVGAAPRLIDHTTSRSGTDRELSPSFTPSAGRLVWARRNAGGRSWILALPFPGRVSSYLAPDPIQALATSRFVISGEQAAGELFCARGDDHHGTTIQLMLNPPATRLG